MSQTLLKKGDCECCERTNVDLLLRNGMAMCQICRDDEDKVVPTVNHADSLIEASRKIDQTAQIKTDIFRLNTTAAIELKGSIDQDQTISESQRDYMMAKAALERYQHFSKIGFDHREAAKDADSAARAWQTQVQTFAGKLRADLRAEFKNFDVSYQPAPVKIPTKSAGSPKKVKMSDVKLAAQKYNVSAQMITMMMIGKTITAEDAAKKLAETMKAV